MWRGPPAVDDLLDYLVDVLVDDAGSIRCRARSAVQRQHELVALADRCLDEIPERLDGGRSVAFGCFRVVEGLHERCVGEVAEQILAGGEVAVDGPRQAGHETVAPGRGEGIPLGRVLAPANRHDSPLLAPTLDKLDELGPLPGDITVRRLIGEAWTLYRWDTRPAQRQ